MVKSKQGSPEKEVERQGFRPFGKTLLTDFPSSLQREWDNIMVKNKGTSVQMDALNDAMLSFELYQHQHQHAAMSSSDYSDYSDYEQDDNSDTESLSDTDVIQDPLAESLDEVFQFSEVLEAEEREREREKSLKNDNDLVQPTERKMAVQQNAFRLMQQKSENLQLFTTDKNTTKTIGFHVPTTPKQPLSPQQKGIS